MDSREKYNEFYITAMKKAELQVAEDRKKKQTLLEAAERFRVVACPLVDNPKTKPIAPKSCKECKERLGIMGNAYCTEVEAILSDPVLYE